MLLQDFSSFGFLSQLLHSWSRKGISDQQSNCLKINSVMSKFTVCKFSAAFRNLQLCNCTLQPSSLCGKKRLDMIIDYSLFEIHFLFSLQWYLHQFLRTSNQIEPLFQYGQHLLWREGMQKKETDIYLTWLPPAGTKSFTKQRKDTLLLTLRHSW